MDPSMAQHRIWEGIDFCALKIDKCFITNQWQFFPWISFPMNIVQIVDLFLFTHQFQCDVEHFLQIEICCIHDEILNIHVILSHECRRIHRRSHQHSPNYWMLFSWSCNVGHSSLSFSHLVFYFIDKFCCVTSLDESFRFCLFLVINFLRLPRSIMNHLSELQGMRISVEKRFFTMRCNLLHHSPRRFLRFPWSIVRHSSTFPLLRRPRLTIILFWITWWWRFLRFPRSIVYRNRFPRILISIRGPPRVWWSWRRHHWRHFRCQVHYRSRFGCDTFFSWFLLSSFCHCSGASCRTEMANVKQIQQMIPLITCEFIPFG